MDKDTEKRLLDDISAIKEHVFKLPCPVHEEKFKGYGRQYKRLWWFMGILTTTNASILTGIVLKIL